ncbi:helix-turn-helix domain-containing protein [Longispora sp. K20-0274]|uniref:PucR family transcriptional regulator n=1 Tax=Longispora sp. K20-0274 TaxID=3088255 RepID=UPI00399BEE10
MGVQQRRAVQREVSAALPAIGEELAAAVQGLIPAYQRLEAAQLAEVRAIAGWALTRVLDLWVRDGALDAADLARFRGIGAARAADGRPLPAVLRAYRVAATRAIDIVVGRGRDTLDVADTLALTRLWLASIDALSEAVYSGYTSAADRLTGDRGRALRELLDDLLVGRQASAGAWADRCRELGVDIPARPTLLLVESADPARVPTEADGADLAAGLGLAGDTPRRYLLTVRGHRLLLLLPGTTFPAGAGSAAPGGAVDTEVVRRGWRGCRIETPLAEAPIGYRLAVDALDTAPAHAHDGGRLLDTGDAHLLALLAGRPAIRSADIAHLVLGPLADPGNAHLLDGLDAFLAAGTATGAAERLGVHPQTLRYRLRRVRECTGRDPRTPWQRLVLDVARHLLQIG